MASRRAGYFRGGEPEAKPLPPLRDRICPALKQLADIDALEKELDRAYNVPDKKTGRTMDADEYFHLMHVLEKKRDRIAATQARLEGESKASRGGDSADFTITPSVPFEWPSWPQLSPLQGKVLFIAAVFAFLFIRQQFFA